MDFTQRGSNSHSGGASHSAGVHVGGNGRGKRKKLSFERVASIILLFAVTILAILLVVKVGTSTVSKESKYVDESKLQAVFLNGGQVYFGDITALNNQYLKLNNIYYLRVNQTVQPNQQNNQNNNDVSLVKLGCELHGPQDQMVINREQIIFWENLKTDGQVAKAVETYVKQNPDGQKCNTQTTTNTNTNTNN
jgi:hypothetical protein